MVTANEKPGSKSGREGSPPSDSARVRKAEQLGELLTALPKWAAYAVIAWQAALSIQALAGKNGIASLLTRFGRETSLWELVCWAAGLAGIFVALYTRHLLRRQTARDNSRIDALERRLNAGRSALLSAHDESVRE